MKAKKIIAIGLVATMTLGMSTSVFATATYPDYTGAPEFENWDKEFGPDDNAYHVKGQGWLESGTGVNESSVNVLVPTTPYVDIKRGEPGLFDFGFDPQRLVQRTTHAKYDGKEIFTDAAIQNGVYFLNGPSDGELNTFDNKSVKYEAVNIGTEDVALTVKATLAGGNNFAYLEEDPSQNEARTANGVYSSLYEVIGSTWESFVTTNPSVQQPYHSEENANKLYMAKDMAAGQQAEYTLDDVGFNDDEWVAINATSEITFMNTTTQTTYNSLYAVLKVVALDVDSVLDLEAALTNYVEVLDDTDDEDAVGMYMGLNVATGEENREYAEPKEVPFKTANDAGQNNDTEPKTIDAAATFTQVVKGNPDNYKTIWDPGTKTYRYAMKEERTEPFQTVAFWFRGVATENATLPSDLAVPALDFTWSFSTEIPEPVVEAPKLAKINQREVPQGFDNTFNYDTYKSDESIVLGFTPGSYEKITRIKYSDQPNKNYRNYSRPDSYYTINDNTVIVNVANIFNQASSSARYWRVYFGEEEKEFVQLTFTPSDSVDP